MRFLLLTLISCVSFAHAEDRIGRFYEVGAPATAQPIFIQRIHRETDANGQTLVDTTIEDADGKMVMREHAVIKGEHIQSQTLDQYQVKESYDLVVEDGKIKYRTYSLNDGKRTLKSENSSSLTDQFITGPSAEIYLRGKIDKKGQTADADFGIFEMEKPIGFEFKNKGLTKDESAIQIVMSPRNFFVAMFAPTMKMEVDKTTYQLTRYEGRTPVRRNINGRWKSIDALVLYEDVKTRVPASK